MSLKQLGMILAIFMTLAAGLEAGYRIGSRNPIPLSKQFKEGWNRGYASGMDAGKEDALYYVKHTRQWKQGWDACQEQF